jgi:hypothetical protein
MATDRHSCAGKLSFNRKSIYKGRQLNDRCRQFFVRPRGAELASNAPVDAIHCFGRCRVSCCEGVEGSQYYS